MTNESILRLIGRNVREARMRTGMTQKCLAEFVEVHWKTVSYIERGKYPFSVTTFARLTQFLEVSPNRLLEGMEPPDEERRTRVAKALTRKRRAPAKDA